MGGVTIDLPSTPSALRYRPDLGVLLADGIKAESLHAWPPPRNVLTCPRAVITPGGDYLVLFIAGVGLFDRDRKANDMVAYRSSDKGKSWRGPFLAWDVPYSGLAAVLFRPRGSRRLYAFGTEYLPELREGAENGPVGVRISDDDGHTWSPVRLIEPVNAPGYKGMVSMRPCETDGGTWLLSTHAETWRTEDWAGGGIGTRQYLLRSEDQGHTWELLPGSGDQGWVTPGFERMDEGVPLALEEGRVVMQVRTPEGHLWELRSEDDGRTWTGPQPTTLVHPDAPPMFFTLADGKTLAAFHHNRHTGGHFNFEDRSELWVSLSTDEGRTWSEPRFVVANACQPFEIAPRRFMRSVSYVDLLADEERLHLFVDHQFRHVIHLEFGAEDLRTMPTQADLMRLSGPGSHPSA